MKRLRQGLNTLTRSSVGVASIAAVLTAGIAVYVISPRFHVLHEPSLIDDWSSLHWSSLALHQLEHLKYDSALFDTGRYRPAFYGIWSYLQWHTFGAPATMRGPNAWNLLRICGLALALALLVVAGLRPDRRGEQRRLRLGLLAAVPAFLLFTTPAFGVDLARFGPQEPLLIAGLGLGGLALVLAAWLVLERRANPLAVAALVFAGFLLWAFGVYMKEASVCVFVLAPFLVLELRARWWPRRVTRWTTVGASAIALLALIPMVQLTVEVIRISHEPTLIYGSAPPHGLGQWITRVKNAIEQQWNGIPSVFGQDLWQGLAMALPPLLVAVWARTRRPPWLALGMLALGWTVLVFQGLPGVVVSRYYMPVFAAFGIALVLLIAELPTSLQVAVIVAIAVLGVNGIPGAHRAVQGWVAGEQSGQELVDATAQLNPRRCPVYYANFDIERHFSLPIVLALQGDTGNPCLSGQAALVIEGGPSLPSAASQPIVAACSAPGWQGRLGAGIGTIYSCAHLRRGTVLLPSGARQPVADILAQDRLVIPRSASAS